MTRLIKPRSLLTLSFLLCIAAVVHAFDNHKPFDISADVLEYDEGSQVLSAEGNVVVIQASSTLNANRMQYDRKQKRIQAQGNVVLRDKGSLLMGAALDYDLALENAQIEGGKGFGSPWYFQGTTFEKQLDFLIGKNASFTTCDLIDPHYHMRSSRVHLIPDKIFWSWNNTFYLDQTPFLYSPFLYKSLGPRNIVFQAEPGHDSVKGSFAKTTTTMRFRPGIYDKVLVDYYTVSGTGIGNEFNYERPTFKGSLFGYYIDPQGEPELAGAPSDPQYNVRFYHWQAIRPDLIWQANVNHRKNVSFNNTFFTQDTNQSVNDVNNSNALTYSNQYGVHRLVAESMEAPDEGADPLFGNTHIQTASLPRYEVNFYQKPIWSPKISTSTLDQVLRPNRLGALQLSGGGNVENFYNRLDEKTRLRGNANGTLGIPINISRRWSLSPSVTPSMHWQDKADPVVESSTNVVVIPGVGNYRGYQGRMGSSTNLRYRALSSLTLDQTYNYALRFAPNSLTLDDSLQDGGVETHHLNWLLYWRPSRLLLTRSFSGYDLRQLEAEDPAAFRQRRIDPWTNEVTIYQPNSRNNYFFRHQLGYYPSRSLLWEADARWYFAHNTRIESGVNYNASTPDQLTWNNKVGFYFSPAWRVDATVNSLLPKEGIDSLTKVSPISTEIRVTRTMHCWDVQFRYRDLPPFTREYSLLFNLRLGVQQLKEITNNELESQFYPWRADGP